MHCATSQGAPYGRGLSLSRVLPRRFSVVAVPPSSPWPPLANWRIAIDTRGDPIRSGGPGPGHEKWSWSEAKAPATDDTIVRPGIGTGVRMMYLYRYTRAKIYSKTMQKSKTC
jgi:hypothetical protein